GFSLEDIIGVIYPVPSDLLERIFEGKDVFIKHPTCFKLLKPGHKVLFYASHDVRAIVGEATIKRMEFLSLEEVYKKYGKRVFITKEEALRYATPLRDRKEGRKGRKDVKFLVLELENVKRYRRPYKPKRFITVGGKYLSEREYRGISFITS
ncbi:DUF365 domain-containing protein, partial [Thermococcus sp.]